MTTNITKTCAERLSYAKQIRKMNEEWESLCATYLPCVLTGSIWRFSRGVTVDDPEQGWKIHISATALSTCRAFRKVAPMLRAAGVLFKAPLSLLELRRINCGLFYGFGQVGKLITVYPRTPAEAVSLARKLHRTTYGLPSPTIPYDLAFRRKGCVYYRYGSFNSTLVEFPDGSRARAIRDPSGKLVPDSCGPNSAVPPWITNPFTAHSRRLRQPVADSLLGTTIFAYEALSQRGKGGVYRAIDKSVFPARLCILKEGRRHGETSWDGVDGYWRIRHEELVVNDLHAEGINVPRIYHTFEENSNYYLVMELIEGDTLQSILEETVTGLPVQHAFRCAIDHASLMGRIHSTGWVWRDCKPSNLILDREGSLRPLDFEGACRKDAPDPVPWVTADYNANTLFEDGNGASRLPDDLYALGVILNQLFGGQSAVIGDCSDRRAEQQIGIPRVVRNVISALTSQVPELRPNAHATLNTLVSAYAEYASRNTSRRTFRTEPRRRNR
jgi:hypothetical protein